MKDWLAPVVIHHWVVIVSSAHPDEMILSWYLWTLSSVFLKQPLQPPKYQSLGEPFHLVFQLSIGQ